MSKRIIKPPSLAQPRGFNHGVLTSGGQILWLAGQDASDAQGRIVGAENLVAQMEQTLRNLRAVVAEAGGAMTDIVKLTIFVRSRENYLSQRRELGVVWQRYFGDYYPALALFEVSGFFQRDALIEIEGVAVLGAEQSQG